MAGRPAKATHHVEKLSGSEQAKLRLQAILETLAGEKTVREAARESGLCEARFAELRDRMLGGALGALEPRPAGRQPESRPVEREELERLAARVNELEIELVAAHLREEIAQVMPEVLQRAPLPGGNRRERRRRRALAARRSGASGG